MGGFVGWQGTVRQRSPRQGRGSYTYIYIYIQLVRKKGRKEKEETRGDSRNWLAQVVAIQCSLERGFNRFVQTRSHSLFLSFLSHSIIRQIKKNIIFLLNIDKNFSIHIIRNFFAQIFYTCRIFAFFFNADNLKTNLD